MKTILTLVLIALVPGCRIIHVITPTMEIWAGSFCSETGIENALLEPDHIESGTYTGKSNKVKAVTPYGTIETE